MHRERGRYTHAISAVVLFSAAWLGAACADAGTGPTDSSGASFSSIPVAQASSELAAGNLRVEVLVKPGSNPLVAAQLALDHPNMAGEPEAVAANATALTLNGTDGAITTDLGVTVRFDAKTVLAKDEGGVTVTLDQFAGALKNALAAGQHPHLRARRAPPAAPQAPADSSFLADGIKLGGTSTVLELDLNAGKDNLQVNANPPPDALLLLLGLSIEVRISDSITKVGHQRDSVSQGVTFESPVKSVDTAKALVVLTSGATVQLSNKTTIKVEGTSSLRTLADVAAALAAGVAVRATGNATVVSTDPRVLAATVVAFEAHRELTEFHEVVKSVNGDGKTFTLSNGILVCLDDHSTINQEGGLKTLAEVASAIAAGKAVGAAGTAAPPPTGSSCRAIVIKVRFDVLPPAATEFHDMVTAVDTTGHTLTLAGGVVLCVNTATVIDQEGDLKSLAEVAAALAAGKIVGAGGSAGPAGDGVTACKGLVLKVRFSVAPPPTTTFREGVKAVDLTGKFITLTSGIMLCLDDHTVISQEGAFKSLVELAGALVTGRNVVAAGTATAAPQGAACRGLVVTVKFSI